jgi:DNA-binding NarL/FixJ family response regulator
MDAGLGAANRGDWETAREIFSKVAAENPSAEAFEWLSWAAYSLDDAERLFPAREEAFRLYRQAGDYLGAARMAMWLGADHIDFRGSPAVASGWRQRARRLLKGQPLAPEHGWLAVIDGDATVMVHEDSVRAAELGRQAVTVGRELGVVDVEALGLVIEGIATVTQGRIDDGMLLLDEGAAVALSGEMSDPAYVGWALCYLIFACERAKDLGRAAEWCIRMREYAEQTGMSFMRAICRVHYAGVLIWRGEWKEAESELADAASQLPNRPLLAADGTTRLAELRLRQGRLRESEELYRSVEWHPLALLGLAELAIEEGRAKDAVDLLDRLLRHTPESSRTQRVDAFGLLVRACALLGDAARAAEALEQVQSLSEAASTLPLRAASSFCAGGMAVAAKDYDLARARFEDAIDLYEQSGAPFEVARARLELASIQQMLGRPEQARREAEAALAILERLGSIFHAGRAKALLKQLEREANGESAHQGPLTDRQIEILRLISKGLNDREIAAALVLSEHTVHRHVANILQRLDLPSRSAAVAYASSVNLI